MYPYLLSNMKSWPDSFLTESSTALIPRASLSNTSLTSPPFCMEMILSWSSSLTQVKKVLSLLWKIPRPSGQSLSMPATLRLGSPDIKRKWSSTNCCRTFSLIPVRGKYDPARSPLRFANAFFIRFSTSILCCLVIPGERPNPSIFRPTRIRVDWTFLADGSPDFACIHVACVGGIGSNTMVLLDQWIKHIRKDLVRVPISSINTTMLIVELHGTSNGLCEGESGSGSLGTVELLPDGLGHVLGDQGMLGLDFWEGIRHIDGFKGTKVRY